MWGCLHGVNADECMIGWLAVSGGFRRQYEAKMEVRGFVVIHPFRGEGRRELLL